MSNETIDVPCEFGGVSFEGNAAIGVKIKLDDVKLPRAYENICKSQVDVTLCEVDPDQGTLDDVTDSPQPIKAVGNAHRLSVGLDDFTFRLAFDKTCVNHERLSNLAKTTGRIKLRRTGKAGEDPNDKSAVGDGALLGEGQGGGDDPEFDENEE